MLSGCVERALDRCHVAPMRHETLYDDPHLYDLMVPRGPCEPFYRSVARSTGGPVLELACGTGRLTIPLAQYGHNVVGLDSSACMLRRARAKAAEAGVPVSLIQGDMRDFDLGQRFALVIVSCNSLAHLTGNDDLLSCFRAVERHLAPGGLLAFDITNPRLRELAGADKPCAGGSTPTAISASEALSYDPVLQVRISEWSVAGPSHEPRAFAPLVLRQIFPQELPLLLGAAGLELAARYGDFDGNALVGESLNQVCLARATQARAV
jgi:SAM-dependent methyltransferase